MAVHMGITEGDLFPGYLLHSSCDALARGWAVGGRLRSHPRMGSQTQGASAGRGRAPSAGHPELSQQLSGAFNERSKI